jgi:6-phosphogluconolactonase
MERPCDGAAVRYEKELRGFFAGEGTFDLALLGLGEDGHTASLFPGEPATLERERWVVHVETRAKPPPDRLTLTLPVFARAATVAFLVAGDGKRSILERVLEPRTAADRALPATLVRAREELSWFVDRAARG